MGVPGKGYGKFVVLVFVIYIVWALIIVGALASLIWLGAHIIKAVING